MLDQVKAVYQYKMMSTIVKQKDTAMSTGNML
jgi:hypothetical protein